MTSIENSIEKDIIFFNNTNRQTDFNFIELKDKVKKVEHQIKINNIMRASKLRKERAAKRIARNKNRKLSPSDLKEQKNMEIYLRESENLAKRYLLKQKTLAQVKKKAEVEFPEIVKQSLDEKKINIVYSGMAEPGPNEHYKF